MRLRILLPKVNPEAITVPTRCAYAGCSGRKFYLRQEVAKPLRDTCIGYFRHPFEKLTAWSFTILLFFFVM